MLRRNTPVSHGDKGAEIFAPSIHRIFNSLKNRKFSTKILIEYWVLSMFFSKDILLRPKIILLSLKFSIKNSSASWLTKFGALAVILKMILSIENGSPIDEILSFLFDYFDVETEKTEEKFYTDYPTLKTGENYYISGFCAILRHLATKKVCSCNFGKLSVEIYVRLKLVVR